MFAVFLTRTIDGASACDKLSDSGQGGAVRRIWLKIDLKGTLGEGAWAEIQQFPDVSEMRFGPEEGSGGPCQHLNAEPHPAGEWWGAVVVLDNNFLAEYALPHYLEQARVLDAFIEQMEDGP